MAEVQTEPRASSIQTSRNLLTTMTPKTTSLTSSALQYEQVISELKVWLKTYWVDLKFFRSIEVAQEMKLRCAYELVRVGFTAEQRVTAEKWRDYGDWSFKKKGQEFSFQDFFPTREQLESIRQGFILLSREELALKLRRERETTEAQVRAELTRKPIAIVSERTELEQAWHDYNIKCLELEQMKLERLEWKAKYEKLKKASTDSETDKRIFDTFGRFEGLKEIIQKVVNDDADFTYTKALQMKAKEKSNGR